MTAPDSHPLPDGELLAAVDLGSNSFHMVVARAVLGQLRIVDRIKEHVRLAEGLDGKCGLSKEALIRAHDCLERLSHCAASFVAGLDAVPDTPLNGWARAVASRLVVWAAADDLV